MKHTPGPWKVCRTISGEKEDLQFVGTNSDGEKKYNVMIEAPAYFLCGVSGIGKEECLGNAQLIAAAPELLEACEYAYKLIAIARNYFPKSIKHHAAFQLENTCATLGKAIRKAKGQS